MSAGTARSTPIPWVFAAAAMVRILMVITYPLNFWISDGRNYMEMLVDGTSNLIHSPGYPFIMGLPWRNALGRLVIESHPAVFQFLLNLSQHMLCIAAAFIGYRVIRDIFTPGTATLFAALYLLDYRSIFVCSTVTPEWLQAGLIIVVYAIVYRAWKAVGLREKTLLYSLSGVLFAAAYLVKFNSLFLLTCPGLIALADLRRSRKSILALGSGVLSAVVVYLVFLVFFHQPSTGTYSITLDKGWVLMEKVEKFVPGHTLSPETGIETKRLIILNSLLPPIKHKGPIARVDFVDEATRAPYKEKYLHIFSADEQELDTLLKEITIRHPFDFTKAFLPSAYFLDLEKSNTMCVGVFREQVAAFPGAYLKNILELTMRQFIEPNTVSHPTNPMSFRKIGVEHLQGGRLRLKLNVPQMRKLGFWYDRPIVWRPGTVFFLLLSKLEDYPAFWITILISISCFLALKHLRKSGRLDLPTAAVLFVALGCLLFLIASNAVYHFRWKELHAIFPLIVFLCSTALVELSRRFCPGLVEGFTMTRNPRPQGTPHPDAPGADP